MKASIINIWRWSLVGALLAGTNVAVAENVSQKPLFLTNSVSPQIMLSMSNDHQLYFEAYPEYVDLDDDGEVDLTYKNSIDYYGYFDSYKCYSYDTSSKRYTPEAETRNKYCDSVAGDWSGNFLNWVSMSRMDVVRKILYGGLRSTDTGTETVLERSYITTDAHAWARYYDGTDIDRLTPFSYEGPVVTTSTSAVSVGTGNKTFKTEGTIAFTTTERLQRGDQIEITTPDDASVRMLGYVDHRHNTSGDVTVNVSFADSSAAGASFSSWQLTNLSRKGVSFCNLTYSSSGRSENVTEPPLIRVARGDYGLWDANERFQCLWHEEESSNGRINSNDIGISGIAANRRNPRRGEIGLGSDDYVARVEVCSTGLIGTEDCKRYPDGNYKPKGLLQTYGDEDLIDFGLMSGSNVKNKSGGVLRKNIAALSDEVNVDTDGTFITPAASVGSIINSLDLSRIYGYNHGDGLYNNTDNCAFGLSSFNDGQCTGWGNPQSEIFLETLRYFANDGSLGPTGDFIFSGDDRIAGLGRVDWKAPLDNDNYCAPLNIVNFNSSVASYDAQHFSSASDLPELSGVASVKDWTNKIGAGEGIHGNQYFIGSTATDTDGLCTSKTVGGLADAAGLCPEAPRLGGSYLVSGLAHYAYTTDLRPDLPGDEDDKRVKTYSVALAPAVPEINIPLPGTTSPVVRMLPACYNDNTKGACAIVDFKIIDQDIAAGTGSYFVNWEDSEQGGDYDQDMIGILSYKIAGDAITVTTQTVEESTSQPLGFGYIISGTASQDGFHVTSGSNNLTYTPPGGGAGCTNCNVSDAPTTKTYTLGTSNASLLESPMFYAAKWGGYDKSNENFPTEQTSWDTTEDGIANPDNYYFATSPQQLVDDLEDVFSNIKKDSASAAAVVANSSRLGTDTAVFQATFNSERWSGDIRAFSVSSTGEIAAEEDVSWSTNDKLKNRDYTTRRIFTNEPASTASADPGEDWLLASDGSAFTWGELDTTQQDALKRTDVDDPTQEGDDNYGKSVLEYLKGDKTNERNEDDQDLDFRQREGLLGTIVNSDPQFYYRQNFGYNRLHLNTGFPNVSYADYRDTSNYKSRPPMIIAGSNSGMLHVFNASLSDADGGEELFAYVPSGIIDNLYEYVLPGFEHRFYVDGVPRVTDAIVDSNWTTVAVGTTGAGGKSVFALDIGTPNSFDKNDVLWEFTHPDMGYTIGQPAVVALPNGKFGVVVTSGYESTSADAKVWILDIDDGRPIETFTLSGSGEPGSPLVVDLDNDRIADRIYVGDTEGKLWRLDVDSISSTDWGIPTGLSGGPLFEAPADQPITAPLASAYNEDDQHMVFFGTGSYYRTGDNSVGSDPAVQAFYGIIDSDVSVAKIDGTSDLLQQEILSEQTSANGSQYRLVSSEPIEDTDKGWYLDLVVDSNNAGERVVARPLVRGDRVIFPTLIPNADMCSFGGNSWLMEVSLATGGNLEYALFDVDEDNDFDDSDCFTITNADGDDELICPSGVYSEIGIITTPAVLTGVDLDDGGDDGDDEIKIVSGSTGEMESISESGSVTSGRVNWEQLR